MDLRLFFLIVAVILFVALTIVISKKEKNTAALNLPIVIFAGIYVAVEFFLFVKLGKLKSTYSTLHMSNDLYNKLDYIIQIVVFIFFAVIEIAIFGGNKYIRKVEQKEKESTVEFKSLVDDISVLQAELENKKRNELVKEIVEKMRYSDPVSNEEVKKNNEKIKALIKELHEEKTDEEFEKICKDIINQLKIRDIRNKKG